MIHITQLIDLAKTAGTEILKYYDAPKVQYKKGGSPVTEADLASEKLILEGLRQMASGYGIISEEKEDDKSRLQKDYVWVVDPLDGTTDFIQKTGEFSVMIGLVHKGEPIMGVVYQPELEKMYYAEKGRGAFIFIGEGDDIRLRVSPVADISKGRLVVSRNHLSKEDRGHAKKMGLENYIQAGSNGIKMCLIAQGNADLFFNTWTGMGEWDSCAPQIILTEAGGMVTGIDGKPITYNNPDPVNRYGLVASNGILHKEILAIISEEGE